MTPERIAALEARGIFIGAPADLWSGQPAPAPPAGRASKPTSAAAIRLSLSPRDSALLTDQELEVVAASRATLAEIIRFKRRMVRRPKLHTTTAGRKA